ncbi:MAG: hypothetical protein H8D88_00310 [Bacteroidetes bacterium]|nr:hypothetical protein [Bacteroidota bacterium]
MKRVMYYLRLALPVILVIFILGAKPRKAKGQDPDKVKTKTEKTHIAVIECDDGDIVKIDTIIISSADEDFDFVYDYDFEFDTSMVSKNCAAIKLKMDSKGHAYIISTDEGGEKHKRVKLMTSDNDSGL